jgi:hypothetical protein
MEIDIGMSQSRPSHSNLRRHRLDLAIAWRPGMEEPRQQGARAQWRWRRSLRGIGSALGRRRGRQGSPTTTEKCCALANRGSLLHPEEKGPEGGMGGVNSVGAE